MLRSAFLMLAVVACLSVSSAQAAAIQFYGNLASKVGPAGVLQFANNTPFTAYLSVNDSGTNVSSVAFGGFKFGNTEITVSGGSVEIKNGNEFEFLFAPGDTTLATLNGAPNGTPGIAFIGFTFTGVSGLGTGINQTQLGKLNGLTTNFTLSEFGGLPIYSGTITAIPEPSSMLVLGGLVAGFGSWRYRRRKLAQKAC
jgi:hypothetical protein